MTNAVALRERAPVWRSTLCVRCGAPIVRDVTVPSPCCSDCLGLACPSGVPAPELAEHIGAYRDAPRPIAPPAPLPLKRPPWVTAWLRRVRWMYGG